MPKSIVYRPEIIDYLTSTSRIDSYKTIFNPSNDVELMGAYLWNGHVCGSIYPLISTSEIILRNSIDHAFKQHSGNFWWSKSKLKYSSYNPQGNLPKAIEIIVDNFSKATSSTMSEIFTKTRKKIKPTHDQIISKTDFSTWEHLLDDEFMGPSLIWPSKLGLVFRGQWPSQKAGVTLQIIKDQVKSVRQYRNRLFHHEPAWKKYGVKNEMDAIQHLQDRINKIESLIDVIHPEYLRMLNVNGILNAARRACSENELRRFQTLVKTHHVKSLNKLIKIIERSHIDNSIVNVKLKASKHKNCYLFTK